MSKAWFITLFLAAFSVIAVCLVYGLYTVIFPFILLLAFFLFFRVYAFAASIQANAIPGIEQLDEPDFFLSQIYMAWLYVNDRKRWAKYAAIFSYLSGAFFGSLFGILISFSLRVNFNVSFASWLLGMSITLLTAMRMATSKRWVEAKGHETINCNHGTRLNKSKS